jgi:tRNA (mo5U34)-methyltransferase
MVINKQFIKQRVGELAPWFHYFDLDGVPTKTHDDLEPLRYPEALWECIKDELPSYLNGLTALDIGCNAGYFSIELARRGAKVFAVDSNQDCLGCKGNCIKQAEFVRSFYTIKGEDLKITYDEKDWFKIPPVMEFNVVFFLGVYYHLQNWDRAFKRLRELLHMNGTMIVESLITHEPEPILNASDYNNDKTNYYVPTKASLIEDIQKNGLVVEKEIPHYDPERVILKVKRA